MLKMEGSGRFMRTFAHLNPRVALRYSFGNGHTLKTSYTNMVQYLHKASNSTLGMPYRHLVSGQQRSAAAVSASVFGRLQLRMGERLYGKY